MTNINLWLCTRCQSLQYGESCALCEPPCPECAAKDKRITELEAEVERRCTPEQLANEARKWGEAAHRAKEQIDQQRKRIAELERLLLKVVPEGLSANGFGRAWLSPEWMAAQARIRKALGEEVKRG